MSECCNSTTTMYQGTPVCKTCGLFTRTQKEMTEDEYWMMKAELAYDKI